ncbi:MAG: Sel1-repeat containing protein [Alphaproteobacteria bacterium]|jgi:TPR repeat protein|nr:Sel1-repeat containing protein [Alphaproteobacteria bacterium]
MFNRKNAILIGALLSTSLTTAHAAEGLKSGEPLGSSARYLGTTLFLDGTKLLKQNMKTQAYECFKEGGKLGDPNCSYAAGHLALSGYDDVLPNKRTAFSWFKIATEKGHNHAPYYAGKLWLQGIDEKNPSNKENAFKFFKKGAKRGHNSAIFEVGCLLEEGFPGQPADKKKALDYYVAGAKEGDMESQFNAGLLLAQGFEGQDPNLEKAADFFVRAAKAGREKSNFNAGMAFLKLAFQNGKGPTKGDPVYLQKALNCFISEEGHIESQFHAGLILEEGFEGQLPNLPKAYELYTKAAEKGHKESLTQLGAFVNKGFEGQPSNKRQALEYSIAAAEEGDMSGQFNAGVLLAEGFEGQPPDIERAIKYFVSAAQQGMTAAMRELFRIHIGYNSDPSFSDSKKAAFWAKRLEETQNNKKYASLLEELPNMEPAEAEAALALQFAGSLRKEDLPLAGNKQNQASEQYARADRAVPDPIKEPEFKEKEAEEEASILRDRSQKKSKPANIFGR